MTRKLRAVLAELRTFVAEYWLGLVLFGGGGAVCSGVAVACGKAVFHLAACLLSSACKYGGAMDVIAMLWAAAVGAVFTAFAVFAFGMVWCGFSDVITDVRHAWRTA